MLVLATAVFVVIVAVLANSQEARMQEQVKDLDCGQCHTCQTPTARDACLKPCYRHTALSQSGQHQIGEAPDSILLDAIAHDYVPILFDHKIHAEMAGMSNNCNTCHHYSPEGEIPPCRSCHPAESSPENMAQPDLKTAYHRQCLVCHSQWAHEAACDVCHRPPGGEGASSQYVKGTFALPTVKVPVAKTYRTSHDPAPVVTFQHVEHIELFEFECVDCHQHENCRYCHDQVNREGLTKSFDQVHSICSGCHDIRQEAAHTGECAECHDRQERAPQFHSIVGNTLPAYLKHEGCDGCHPDRRRTGATGTM